MGLIDDIKNDVRKSGTNKGKIAYFKPGNKVRLRFLQELDAGMKVLFHDSFDAGINYPCQELYDRECQHHDDSDVRHKDQYIWSVWDYESKEVKLLMGKVNSCSPVPQLVGFYETYGTIVDRDYVITKTGQGTNQTWAVVPMDKVTFKNSAAKPFSKTKTMSILDKAFPAGDDEEDEPKQKRRHVEEDDDEAEVAYKKRKKAPVEDDEDEDEETPVKSKKKARRASDDYEGMTPRELYDACVEKDLTVKPRQSEEYYIKRLKAAEEEDEDDDDAW